MSFHKTISMDLSAGSIDRAIQEIRKTCEWLQACCDELVKKLTEMGVTIAKMNVVQMGAFYTGALEASIRGYFSPSLKAGFVLAGEGLKNGYAVFVEYGTGIVGEMAPNDNFEGIEWEYDIHNHGESGWLYYNETEGKVRWTNGMPARPFMYNTLKQLRESLPGIAESAFSGK